jgi:hypothetical protein
VENTICRPDFSEYVVHFTKNRIPISAKRNGRDTFINNIKTKTAKERLFSILKDKCIRATRMPWTNKPAVCFTECTWSSLLVHAKNYSRYGVGFKKKTLFDSDGGPAIYLSPHLKSLQNKHTGSTTDPFDVMIFSFVTPFCPPYASSNYIESHWKGKKPIDYTHEREWRVPKDFNFNYTDISFVIVANYEDMAKAPRDLKDVIGRENWLLMDNYEKIENLWPVHRMPSSA